MEKIDVTLGEFDFVATYEIIEGDQGDYDYPGVQPTVRLWRLETNKEENVTDTLTREEWVDVEEQIIEKLEL